MSFPGLNGGWADPSGDPVSDMRAWFDKLRDMPPMPARVNVRSGREVDALRKLMPPGDDSGFMPWASGLSIPVVLDPDMPPDMMLFTDGDGGPLSAIMLNES